MDAGEKRSTARALAGEVAWEINKATTVTPSALTASALLTHPKRGITSDELLDRVALHLPLLRRAGARFSETLQNPERAVEEAMQSFVASRFISRYDENGATIFQAVEGRRISLDYYRNNILHFFLPGALLAVSIRSAADVSMTTGLKAAGEDVRRHFGFISRLFDGEFVYPGGVIGGALYDRAVENLVAAGLVHLGPGGSLEVRPEERPTLALMRSQILQLLESYLIVIRTIRTLKTNIRKKEFLKRALKTGTMLYRKGDIERAEAISEVSFANAIRYALERGILREFTGLGGEGAKKKGRSELVFYWPKEGEELLERDEAAIRRLLD